MADSPILRIPLLSTSQAAKEQTINAAIDALEKAMNDAKTINFAGANVTLPLTDLLRYFMFKATATGATSTLNITPTKRLFVIDNLMNATVLKVQAGSSILNVPAGGIVVIYCDGTNLISVADSTVMGGGGGGATTFIALLDTPATYAGIGGKMLRVKASEDGVEAVNYTLASLTDVDLTGLDDGYYLRWNETTSRWVASPIAGGVTSSIKDAVHVATTEAISTAALVIGTIIDDYALEEGSRVLVKNNTPTSQNGIWEVTDSAPVRPSDASGIGSFIQGTVVPVLFGTLNGLKMFMQMEEALGAGITPGTSPMTFQSSSPTLSDLRDVDDTGLANGDVLVWNATDGKWEPGAGGGGSGLPNGGIAGQLLVKQSSTDGDATWEDAPDSLPAGGTTGQVLTKVSNADGDAGWTTPSGGGGTVKREISFFASGKGKNGEILIAYTAPSALTISATGSSAKAFTAASASTVYTIKINGTTVGTVTFSASGTTGVINFTGSGAIPAGGVLSITGPATADASLADLYMTFREV